MATPVVTLATGFDITTNTSKMHKKPDNLLHRIITEKVNNTIDAPLTKLINESESRDVAEILKKLNVQSIEDDILRSAKRHHSVEPWRIDLSHNDFAVIIESLNSNSALTRIQVLDKLLNIDIDTKQTFWEELSQSLRKCFVSPNYDIFLRTLKIHHRLSDTSCDGYANLLRGTFLLLNSRYFTDFNKIRILQTLQVVLGAQNSVIKFLLHANHNVIDEITTGFISVLTYKTVFDWFGALDPQSNWIRVLCYGSDVRYIFFNNLKEKKPDFIKHIFVTFMLKINEEELGVHYGNFLLHFWRYNSNVKFLPEDISVEGALEAVITKLSQGKRNDLNELFIDLFRHNPSILTPKLLDVLVAPLGNTNRNNIRNVVNTNKFIFTVINEIAMSRNDRVLFGISGTLRKGKLRQVIRNVTNLPQKITDLTVLFIKLNLNSNEINQDVNSLSTLLQCCVCVYESHPLALLHGNPTKLIQSVQELYQSGCKNKITEVLLLFTFFCANYGPAIKFCTNEILLDLFSFVPIENLKSVINRLGNDKCGFEFLKNHRNKIIAPYLEQIWYCDENTNSNYINKFVFFVFVIKLTARSVIALLTDDDDDTVVESEDKSVTLSELIEKCLNESIESSEEYLGLLVMKVLITNLDLLLYLNTNYQIQVSV